MRSQLVYEQFALGDLLEGNVLIGFVRLRDIARAANDRGDACLLEKPGFCATGLEQALRQTQAEGL